MIHDQPLTPEDEDQLQRLYDRAMDSGPTKAALTKLTYCYMLDRITSGNLELALDTYADDGTAEAAMREMEALTEEEQADLAATIAPTWNQALGRAVLHLWHACRTLGYDPEGLGGDHLALVGSMFVGGFKVPD
jgi:hypothetical protein